MKMQKPIASLQFITGDIPGFSHAEQVERACSAGVKWIQLRMKGAAETEFEDTAQEVKKICQKHDVVFVVNDNVNVALKVQADGVHLGKGDLLPSKARHLLEPNVIIGGTANTLSDMLWCTEEGCDYIGVGPYRYTDTKKSLAPIVGRCGLTELIEAYSVKAASPVPVIAIGGVTSEDVSELIQSGYHGVAVSGAIAKALNPATAATKLLQMFPSTGGDSGGSHPNLKNLSDTHKPPRRNIIPYDPRLKERARNLRNNSTLSEILLWQNLKGKQMKGFDFDRQRPIDNYIVDFYCKDLMLALEIDGSSHDNKFLYDARRQQKLESLGVRFLRFTDLEVKKNLRSVLRTIENWIEETELVPYGHHGPSPKSSSRGLKNEE
ncbi:MAG TPA: thiamine phosphate synthase [Flavobacteriales bacterium]|nr:thiamine phosphate synthase [Flavobacteriales bacterium]